MKILQAVHGFPPDSSGGAEIYAWLLSKELAALGHDVHVFHRTDDKRRDEYELATSHRDGLTLHAVNNRLSRLESFEMMYRNPNVADVFTRVLLDVEPHVVHVHHLTLLSTDIIEVCRDHGVPVVMTLHDYWMICQKGQMQKDDGTNCERQVDAECDRCLRSGATFSPFARKAAALMDRLVPGFAGQGSRLRTLARNRLSSAAGRKADAADELERIRRRQDHVRRMLAIVDAFMATSRYVKRKYVEFGVPEEKITYMQYSADVSFASRVKRTRLQRTHFGYVGSLMKSKGIVTLLEAFERIGEDRASLSVHGRVVQRPDVAEVEAAIARHSARANVSINGSFSPADKAEIFSQMDVLVCPSLWQENSPAVIWEAFAVGIPVIASNIGGIPEIVTDGVNGVLVPPGDVATLAAAMERMCDPAEVKRLSAGIPHVRAIGDDAREYARLYERLLGGYAPPTPAEREAHNLALLDRDMQRRSGFWESRPMLLEMSTNNVCDLECIMCAPEGHPSPSTLRKDDVRRFAAFLFPSAGVLTPSASSEPFLGNLYLMNELCSTYGVQINLITNANFLTVDAFERIRDNLGRIQVSLDSCDPALYAKIRRGGDFARVDEHLRAVAPRARAAGIEVVVSGVLTTETIERMAPLVRYAAQAGASAVAFQRLIHIVEGLEEIDPFQTMPRERIDACFEAAKEAAEGCGIDLHIDDGRPHVYRHAPPAARPYRHDFLANRFIEKYPGFCFMAAMYAKVDADGTVYPCCRSSPQIAMGNVHKRSLRDIWNGAEWQKLRREMFTGDLRPWCRDCPFHRLGAEAVEPEAEAAP